MIMSVSPVYSSTGNRVLFNQMLFNKQYAEQAIQQARNEGKNDPARKIKEIQQPSPFGGTLLDIRI